ncbi:MAG TPA: DUF58 domain-containing protein [Actinomycetota bacterium]|nr:DUF58 domain-containing protein [Actinomycetota bacterium]
MPTVRGWLTAAAGIAVWVLGRVLDATPLEQIGAALVIAVVAAVVVVRARRARIDVARTVSPERAPSGRLVTVELRLVNSGRTPAPLLLLDDRLPVELSGHARFALNGVEPGGDRTVTYRIRPALRGRYEVGPLRLSFVDPFGLARSDTSGTDASAFLVYPRIEQLALPRDLGERRSVSVSALRQPSGARGEEFYTMREYVEGDDLRRIHWPSTAKRARPMIRLEETPWHTRATIVLDDRRGAHDGFAESSSFERSVEACASLAALYHRSGYSFRVAGAHEAGVPTGKGTAHLHRCLDLLATVRAQTAAGGDDPLAVRLAELHSTTTPEGTLVVVSGGVDADEAVMLSLCKRRFRQVVVVLFAAHRYGVGGTRTRWEGERRTHEVVRLLARAGMQALVLGPEDGFGRAWASLSNPHAHARESRWDPKAEPV